MNYIYITGTGSGIGKALAVAMLKDKKNKVIGISRSNSIEHPNFLHISLDLSKTAILKKFRFEKLGNVDKVVLVNNAGSLGDVKYFGGLNKVRAINGWILNVVAPGILIDEFIKEYRKNEAEKVIINISSGAARSPVDGWGVYCSSKAALEMMTEVVEKEQGIRKNKKLHIFSIAPGIVDTPMQNDIRDRKAKDFSRIEEFKNYKENGDLADPAATAKKLKEVIDEPGKWKETRFRLQY